MSKMNPPIRFKKVVTGYKTIRPVKGDLDIYISQTEAGGQKAEVLDSSGDLVGVVEGANLKEVIKKIREGLLEFGVKFPIQTDASVPFGPTTEEQFLTLDPNNSDVFPGRFTGNVTLSFDGNTSTPLPFSTFDNGGLLEDALNSLPGLEDATVEETSPREYTVTVPIDSPLITSAGIFDEHTVTSTFTFSPEPNSGTFKLTDNFGDQTTAEISYDATVQDILDALDAIGYSFMDVTRTPTEVVITNLTDYKFFTSTDNTMMADATPVVITDSEQDVANTVSVVITN